MSVSDGFLSFVLEQLESLGDVTPRRMFGCAGLYAGEVFFAVLDADTLFFKVDEATIGPYVEAGMPSFQPYPGRPETSSFGYYQVPVRVLEDRDELAIWARRAVEVGRTTRRPPGRRRAAKARGRRKRSAR